MTDKQKEKLSQINSRLPIMDKLFIDLYETFIAQPMVTKENVPRIPGIYVFYKDEQPIYVGRANNIRERIYRHTRPSSSDQSANFAFNLAKLEFDEKIKESKIGRKAIMKLPDFFDKFTQFKIELSASSIRCIEIENDIIQTMFEPYLALKLGTYPVNNNFDNH